MEPPLRPGWRCTRIPTLIRLCSQGKRCTRPSGKLGGLHPREVTMGDPGYPVLRQVVLDTTDARALAEFYRSLLGYEYRPGDEPPPGGDDPKGRDWLVLVHPSGGSRVAFQQVDLLPRSTWPETTVP